MLEEAEMCVSLFCDWRSHRYPADGPNFVSNQSEGRCSGLNSNTVQTKPSTFKQDTFLKMITNTKLKCRKSNFPLDHDEPF